MRYTTLYMFRTDRALNKNWKLNFIRQSWETFVNFCQAYDVAKQGV